MATATGENPYLRNLPSAPEGSYIINPGVNWQDSPNVYISEDGKITARGFIDENDSFEIKRSKLWGLYYEEELRKDLHKVHSMDVSTQYRRSGILIENVMDALYKYQNPIKTYDTTDRKKFSALNKFTQSQAVLSQGVYPFHFHFTGSNGQKWAMPTIDGTWFKHHKIDLSIKPIVNKKIHDLIVIKSGQYQMFPMSPSVNLLDLVLYSSGAEQVNHTSGNMYLRTISISDSGEYIPSVDQSYKDIKIPRQTNSGYGPDATPFATPYGPIGIFKNGVIAYSYHSHASESWNGLGTYNPNYIEARGYQSNSTWGFLSEGIGESGSLPTNTMVYRTLSQDLWNPLSGYLSGDAATGAHSPLLGYAFDGNPIYGPYGYSVAGDTTSAIKRIEPSYRAKQLTNRPSGPEYTGVGSYPTGYFVEDYEYVGGLGDLDLHNGRTGITPEYPTGTYAYFTTIDAYGELEFPYIIGPSFYGNVALENYFNSAGIKTEPVFVKTGQIGLADVDLWRIYGLENQRRAGIEKETIIYVSPHEMLSVTGTFLETGTYQYLGSAGNATFSGNLRTATGQNGHWLTENSSYSYPTSKNMLLYHGPLSGKESYIRIDPNSNAVVNGISPISVTGTDFYTYYSGYKSGFSDQVYQGEWDGKIPAGTPFKIEVWSFGGTVKGFENQLAIAPSKNDYRVSGYTYQILAEEEGFGGSQTSAYAELREKAYKQIYKELDTHWFNEGLTDMNSKKRKYKKILRESN